LAQPEGAATTISPLTPTLTGAKEVGKVAATGASHPHPNPSMGKGIENSPTRREGTVYVSSEWGRRPSIIQISLPH